MTNQEVKMVMEDYKLTVVMYNDTFIIAKWNRCGNDYSKWIGSSNWDILNKKKKKNIQIQSQQTMQQYRNWNFINDKY